MSDGHTSPHSDAPKVDHDSHLTAEEQADQAADLKVILLVFTTMVAIAVVTISQWSPQF